MAGRCSRNQLSLLFKKVQVVRFYDKKRSTLVYLTYSDKLIEGSPKNSISTIVIRPSEAKSIAPYPGN